MAPEGLAPGVQPFGKRQCRLLCATATPLTVALALKGHPERPPAVAPPVHPVQPPEEAVSAVFILLINLSACSRGY